MKRIFAIFLAAMLVFALAACENKTGEVTEPSTTIDEGYKNGDLTVRQKRILTQQGLPTYYEHLTERQKMSITEIEEFLRYAEDKYGFVCEYVDYYAEDMETGILTCVAAEEEMREYVFCVYRELGDEIVDTYMSVACTPVYVKLIEGYLADKVPDVTTLVAALIVNSSITELPIKTEQLSGNINAETWIFVDSATCTKDQLTEIATNMKIWMEQERLEGNTYLSLMAEGIVYEITKNNYANYLDTEHEIFKEAFNIKAKN